MSEKGSLPQVLQLTNSKGADGIFNRDNLFYVRINNTTGFEVQIKSIQSGNVKIAAGKDLIWPSYPDYPFALNFTASFGPGHIATDSITVTFMESYGHCSK